MATSPLAMLVVAVGAEGGSLPSGLLVLIGALFGVFAVVSLLRRLRRLAAVLAAFAVLLVLSDLGVVDLG